MIKGIIFVVVSGAFWLLSREALRDPKSHGYYRFFAFECILLLLLLNYEHWFVNPFSSVQMLSWILMTLSVFLASYGFYLLRVIGKPMGSIEATTKLVVQGAYKYIRHPLYASLILFGWGVFFKDVRLLGGLLAAVNTGFLYGAAQVEERGNVLKFGEEYHAYRTRTKMFVPFVF